MRKYIKPSVKLIDMKDELCDIEQGAETAQPRSVWDD